MEKEFKIQWKEGYVEVSLEGDITFSRYAELFRTFASQENLPKKIRVLGVDNGVNLKFMADDVIKLSALREQAIAQFESVRHAFVVEDPTKTAFAILSSQETYSSNYLVKIFSSKEYAIHWLLEE